MSNEPQKNMRLEISDKENVEQQKIMIYFAKELLIVLSGVSSVVLATQAGGAVKL